MSEHIVRTTYGRLLSEEVVKYLHKNSVNPNITPLSLAVYCECFTNT